MPRHTRSWNGGRYRGLPTSLAYVPPAEAHGRRPPATSCADSPTTIASLSDRRTFLNGVLGVGVAVASTTMLAGCASVAGGAPAAGGGDADGRYPEWDMSWTRKLG
jgi:hypothetical protein